MLRPMNVHTVSAQLPSPISTVEITSVKGSVVPPSKIATQLKGDLSKIALNQLKIKTLSGSISGDASASWGGKVAWKTALDFSGLGYN